MKNLWRYPVAMTLAVLILLAVLFLLWRYLAPEQPGPQRRATDIIRLHDLSDDLVQFRMAGTGVTFRIPRSHLDTILEEDRHVPGELTGSFGMIGMWPGFEKKSRERISEFVRPNLDGNYVRVAVSSACPTRDPLSPTLEISCNLERAMQIALKVFARPFDPHRFVPADSHPGHSVLPFPAMDHIGFQTFKGELYKTVYQGFDENGQLHFAICTLADEKTWPWCSVYFAWNRQFIVRVHFRERNIPHWQAIRDTVAATLNGYVVTDDTPPPPPGIGLTVFPPSPVKENDYGAELQPQ